MALSSVDTNKWAPLLARDWRPSKLAERALDYERTGPLRQRQNRLTKVQVAEMAARYTEGATVSQLAKDFACHPKTAALRLKGYGVEMRYRPASDCDIKRFVELYGSGLSLVKVAAETGFSSKTVMNYLRAEGVQLRDTCGRER